MMGGSLSLRRLLETAAEQAEGHVAVDGESFGASRAVLTQVRIGNILNYI